MDVISISLGPQSVKELQKGWIGYSEGHIVTFELEIPNSQNAQLLECFTTRIDTLLDVKFIALSPNHPVVDLFKSEHDKSMTNQIDHLRRDVTLSREVTLREGKTLKSLRLGSCRHPITGQSMPVFMADYVLDDYGTGAIMGVPTMDERDKRLADKEGVTYCAETKPNEVNAKNEQLIQNLTIEGKKIRKASSTALRDWLVSRQRYWGTPIPVIHCPSCGPQTVPEHDLPVLLSEAGDFESQSSKMTDMRIQKSLGKETKCICPKCGSTDATREKDSLDTFVDSSWYFLRFLDPVNSEVIFDKKQTDFMPVKAYIGGMEHAIKHLLYARFVHKFLFDLGLTDCSEPFENIVTQGLVKGTSYRLKSTGKYISKDEVDQHHREDIIEQIDKMSKSKLNGISPMEVVENHGVDCLKMAMLFAGPVDKDIAVTDKSLTSMVDSISIRHLS